MNKLQQIFLLFACILVLVVAAVQREGKRFWRHCSFGDLFEKRKSSTSESFT